MNEMSTVKKSMFTAVSIALCYVLPLLFHGIQNAGSIFLPMHIPVMICGLTCGWPFGLLCGLAGPALSSMLTGMPPVAYLPPMMVELALYGVITGVVMKLVHTKKTMADLYIGLIAAIVLGRAAAGAARALIFAPGSYGMAAWISGYVITSWPGTLIQLAVVPAIINAMMKAGLIPQRYDRFED